MENKGYTSLGMLAVICWSTTVAFSRSLVEQLGMFTTVAAMFMIAGIVGCVISFRSESQRLQLKILDKRYLYFSGLFFILYYVFLYLAIGLVATRQQVIEIGLINYLWPSLTIVFSVLILGQRARFSLALGIITASVGIYLASVYGESYSPAQAILNFKMNWYAYLFALCAAVSWALYSNTARLWGGNSASIAIPLFLLFIGIIFSGIIFYVQETTHWNWRSMFELIYMALVPTLLGSFLWDKAIKRGNIVIITSFSYLTPLIATFFTCFYLELPIGLMLWLACGLVLSGAVICKYSIVESK